MTEALFIFDIATFAAPTIVSMIDLGALKKDKKDGK